MITLEEYKARRQKLSMQIQPGAVAIIPAANEILRNGDAHYRFRQDSNFYYLTGFNEPESLLIITSEADKSKSYLFNRPRHPNQEQWTGKRLGQIDAPQQLGVDAAYPIETLTANLSDLLMGKSAIYYPLGHSSIYEEIILTTWKAIKERHRRGSPVIPEVFYDLEPLLSEMRLFKSESEINLMRKAAEASVKAHKYAMQTCLQSTNELELEANLLHVLMREGCRDVAYSSIVGGGPNACILHYINNDQPLKNGDLVLIDAGGEYNNYASDITRTFPVSGRFSKTQRQVYDIVLKAQRAGIACIKPGITWDKIQKEIVHVLTQGLVDLKILQGSIESLVTNEAYKSFYMHNSGHWLGLDVHDAGYYKINGEWRTLEAGMVLTVEPGLYISAGMKGVDPCWWDIGIRIEDDILVTETGYEILTADLPAEAEKIEALMHEEPNYPF